MTENDWLTKRFNEARPRLHAVASRMLGSGAEADDALQEAWLRSHQAASEVENAGGWLTTIVARVCLDMLRSRRSRKEDLSQVTEEVGGVDPLDAEGELKLADSIGPALMVVLETLQPTERVAFVLHDTFGLTFEEIAPIVERTPEAARQLASRARRKVRGVEAQPSDLTRHRELVSAFLTASRDGDFVKLLSVLAPEVIFRADDAAVRAAAAYQWGGGTLPVEARGVRQVAETFKDRARGVKPALIDGVPGAVWSVVGQTRAAFLFHFVDGAIARIELVMDPQRLSGLQVELSH